MTHDTHRTHTTHNTKIYLEENRVEEKLQAAPVGDLLLRESLDVERQLGDGLPEGVPPVGIVPCHSDRLPRKDEVYA
jgi:hypothetical protein